MQRVSLPIVMPDDRRAIQAAIRGCARKPDQARIVWIENTLKLDRMWISPTLLADAQEHPRVRIGKDVSLSFDKAGNLQSPWKMDP